MSEHGDVRNPPAFVPQFIIGAGVFTGALAVSNLALAGTLALLMTSLLWVMGMAVLPCMQWLLRALLAKRMTTTRAGQFVPLTPWFAAAVYVLAVALIHSSPRRQFADMVVSPIPQSVNSIAVGRFEAMLRIEWVASFNIAPGDFPKLLEKHPYRQLNETAPAHLVETARQRLDLDLGTLGPATVFEADLLADEADAPKSERKVVVTNEARDRVVFFYLFQN